VESGLKLLPCPFCGGAPVVEPEGPRYFAAFCERCDIIGPFGDGSEDAAKRWNTRTRAPSDAALVEALEEAMGKAIRIMRRGETSETTRLVDALDVLIPALAAAKGQQP